MLARMTVLPEVEVKTKIRKSNVKQKVHGFRARMASKGGRNVLRDRRRKGKKRMTH